MSEQSAVTFLFTDIEGSTRLWEQEPERMLPVMARHDAISRAAVERHHGTVVKMTGDGVHAAFDSAFDALTATIEIQQALATAQTEDGLGLPLRCGLHCGIDERRDGDFYGRAVNRAARIMCAAHGGQILLSNAVAEQVNSALPENMSLRDLGTVRLRDLSSSEHIYQLLHTRLRADFPALRSLESTPNNLTQQLNSFVGRERELAEIKQMLASNRLVTLLAMGGIGKSRLSTQLAADVLDDFPDGVWFVELAALTDPSLVPQAVASVLGVKEEAGRPVIDALTKYVQDVHVLIILDNCEQVVHGCADLAKRLLQAGPQVKILTSSRDYLQIAGEAVYHLPTLSVPDAQQRVDIDSLIQHEAVRLFVDRASAARRDFSLTVQNAIAVVDICRRLDGIPLAIELAAARVRALTVDTIAARLNDRFRLLVTGDQTVLPRQRTLRALIDWSYDLLTEAESILFQRLSVFAGGWTLEAAEAVCADERLHESDVLDLLTRLVEKSLVALEVNGRYRMLDTVRHYAIEVFGKAGNESETLSAHFLYYLRVAEEARTALAGPKQAHWLALLDKELENFLTAINWGQEPVTEAAVGLRLINALRPYWVNRGLLAQGYRVSAEFLARRDMLERNGIRSGCLAGLGQICYFMGRYAEAVRHLTESMTIAREKGDTRMVAGVLQPLGMACLGEGDVTSAYRHLNEAVELARALRNKRELAAALNALAQLHRSSAQLDSAEQLYEEALKVARQLGDHEFVAIFLVNLAMLSVQKDSIDAARSRLVEVLEISAEIGSKPAAQSALEACAGLAASSQQWICAAKFFGAAQRQAEETGLQRDPADEAFLAPLIARTTQELMPQEFRRAEASGRQLALAEAQVSALKWLNSQR